MHEEEKKIEPKLKSGKNIINFKIKIKIFLEYILYLHKKLLFIPCRLVM